jgi:hypothetical protein
VLSSVRRALNNKTMTHAERAQTVLSYRNKQIPQVDFGAVQAIENNVPSMPLYGSGPNKGLHVPLYEKLASDPKMQAMMLSLTDRVTSGDKDKLDIAQIWAETQKDARTQSVDDPWDVPSENTAESNMIAIQAMATLANVQKFDAEKPLPKEISDKLPPELMNKISAAGSALETSKSPKAAVMSHGVQSGRGAGNFTADNNFHFFSHAYLTASLAHQHGVRPTQAEGVSGFAGAQYELLPGSIAERSGNSAIKDLLVNAEGARFGTTLIADPRGSLLPGMFDGPPVEDRTFPRADPKALPAGVKDVVNRAADLSRTSVLRQALGGTIQRKIDSDIQIQQETGVPQTSPRHQ